MTLSEPEMLATLNMVLFGPRLCTEATLMRLSLKELRNLHGRAPKVCNSTIRLWGLVFNTT